MHDTVFTEEALTAGIDQLVGKPIVIYAGGKRREIGEVVSAHISGSRTGIVFHGKITDEEAAGILGAAQDKNQAAASPLGLSEAEVDAVIGGDIL